MVGIGVAPWCNPGETTDTKHEKFIDGAAERAATSRDEAEGLTRAVLQTLAEESVKVGDLAEQLPAGVGQWLRKDDEAAQPCGDGAREGVPALLLTAGETVSGTEFRDMVSQLPKGFWPLAELVAA